MFYDLDVKIISSQFKNVFTQAAREVLNEIEAPEAKASEPMDSVQLNSDAVTTEQGFRSVVLALAAAGPAGGIPALAALSQDIAQQMISTEAEELHGKKMAEQFSSLPVVQDERVQAAWQDVKVATDSPFQAPVVIESIFVDASSDVRNMRFGTEMLKTELAQDDVLAFTVAHEEGHRQNEDEQGARGLEAFAELCSQDDALSGIGIKVLFEGRKQNEREADIFAAEAIKKMGTDTKQVLEFLESLPEDRMHPAGTERAELVKAVLQS